MTMIYQEIGQKDTRASKVAEVRMNLRRVHNIFAAEEERDYSQKEYALDVFKFCDVKNQELREKLAPFIYIALQLEGIQEALVNRTDEEFNESLNRLKQRLKEEMKGV